MIASWLDRLASKFALFLRNSIWLAMPGLIVLAGCGKAGWKIGSEKPTADRNGLIPALTPSTTNDTPTENAPAGSLQTSQAQLRQISFHILRALVPQGAFSASGTVWNHLDEEAVPAETAAVLYRNGLRVGRGNVDAWPPIKALLETNQNIKTAQSRMILNNGYPFLVELDQEPRDQTLFLFRPDGTMAGAPFPASTNVIRIEYTIPLTAGDSVMVEVMPEIRLQPEPRERVLTDDGWARRPSEPPSRVLRELAFRMQLGPEEFVAIGPATSTKDSSLLAGALLLCGQIDGQLYESMYFITPRVINKGAGNTGGL